MTSTAEGRHPRRRTAGMAVSVCAAAIALSACTSSSGSTSAGASHGAASCKIGFAFSNTTVTLYKPLITAVKAEARTKGCTILESFANGDAQKQLSDVQTWIAENVNSIVLLPLDESSVGPIMTQAHAKDIEVVGYAAKIDKEDGSATFGNDSAGTDAGTAIANWLKSKGLTSAEVAVMSTPTSNISKSRTDATLAALKVAFPGAHVVTTVNGQTAADGLQAMQSILPAHPNVKVFLSAADDAILGANRAIVAAHKKSGDILLVGFDGSAEALQTIADGTLNAVDAGLNLQTVGKAIADAGYNVIHNVQPLDIVVPYTVVGPANKDAARQLLTVNQ
jgi:ribose transport system substrate-binding protein